MNQKELIDKIDALKNESNSLLPVKPEYEKIFWEKFRLEFNYNSNHLEGNTMTYGHTQLLLIFDKIGADYTGREVEEMKNHDVAMKLIKDAAFDVDDILTEKFIKEINQTILVRPYYGEAITPEGNPTKRLIEPGQYKKYPNSVLLANGEVFNYASPEETPALMGDLIDWYRRELNGKELHAVQIAALFHYRFVRIHPFDDSNGRTARLLMNYIFMRNGYAPIVIESADKRNYLTALNRADTGEIEAFIDYVVSQSLRWQELYLKAIKGEKIEDPEDFKKDIELLKRKLKNTEDRIEYTLSNETLGRVFNSSICPFLIKLCDELSNFDDFFLSRDILISYLPGRGDWGIANVSKDIPVVLDAIRQLKIKSHPINLKLKYTHNKLRKYNFLQLDHQTELNLFFNEFIYEISSAEQGDIKLAKYYHQIISEDEAKEISALLAKIELNKIKEAIGLI